MYVQFNEVKRQPNNRLKVIPIGRVTLGLDGHVMIPPELGQIEQTKVFQPGNPKRQLTPRDGEAYLRALPHQFNSAYFRAILVEDEAPATDTSWFQPSLAPARQERPS